MGKKKIIGLCLAVGLMVGVVGGSLAWFTDSDTVTNSFATQGNETEDNNGVEIQEIFDTVLAKEVLPGTEVNKDVQVQNIASYPQIIRVNFEKKWENEKLNKEFIELFYQNVTNSSESNKWIKGTDGYYYFNGVVAPGDSTEYLLDYVKLSTKADSTYKNQKYDVIVNADSVQATPGAAEGAWGDKIPGEIKNLVK